MVTGTVQSRRDLDPAFLPHKFLLKQKHLSVDEKYYVWSESGHPLLYVQRPAHLGRSLVALLLGVIAAAAVIAVGTLWLGIGSTAYLVFGPAAFIALLLVWLGVSSRRHVTFYRDDSLREQLLKVEQDRRSPLSARYTVRDKAGNCLARLKKNYLYNAYRKRWYVLAPDGSLISVIKEDAIGFALLRRIFPPLFGVLRTNFVMLRGNSDDVIVEFNRQLTLQDSYVLDLSRDANGHLDPRVALAAGVMLDTGEGR